ncbi:hypothetical protein GCM10011415_14400 [Salipiger pallidus]|uniref:Lipoprotein n=1 Tax=Salipiger pallidus TaxID=1775170 RepID=A0A8J2ZJ16_9RHOB|nr:hypothetical protein [Salipiger pallidus]GGG68319.1 hypothetical protein GCM10011415_14400 [Salipiger pallidus]
MILRATVFAVLAAASLAGCTVPGASRPNASPEQIAAARYQHDGPPAITLYTMISNNTEEGAHSSMMINAPSQRIIFDPAGSVRAEGLVEADDVLYGITPRIADFYARAHARETYRVRIQRIEVPAEVAERAVALAQASGPVGQARCTQATSGLLTQLPGFESISRTWFPKNLAQQLAEMPGVSDRVLREEDADDKGLAIAAFENGAEAQPNQ